MLLIEIRGLKTFFKTDAGVVRAVDGVDLAIEPEQTLGLVGFISCFIG
jgi:ABC-type dipeptide/oligopeptide/nickel transport system ATPase component